MRILQGSKPIVAPADWLAGSQHQRVVIDVGAGDGRWAYDQARSNPDWLVIALDPDATTLSEYAYRASRKPARGGASNALFVIAAVEDLPSELQRLADLVRVNFPWGSLLQGLVKPEPAVLQAVASLGTAAATFEMVISYDPEHDLAGLGGEPLPPLSEARIDEVLAPAFDTTGLQITERCQMSLDDAIALPSTWGRRLLHGRRREVYWIAGDIKAANASSTGP